MVPVTTVPKPRMVNARSTGNRSGRSAGRSRTAKARVRNDFFRSSRPSPVLELTGITSAPLEEGATHSFADLFPYQLDQIRFHKVDLGDHHDSCGNSEQPADIEMLPGLGHDRLVGCHHKKDAIDPAGPSQHVFYESLVAGDVHESDLGALKFQVRKTEVYGDAAQLLFLQPVRVNAGEGLHQRAFAVIDMSCGSDYDMAHEDDRPTAKPAPAETSGDSSESTAPPVGASNPAVEILEDGFLKAQNSLTENRGISTLNSLSSLRPVLLPSVHPSY